VFEPNSPQAYYASQGLISDPGARGDLLAELPTEPTALCRAVQGLLLHVFWAERYGVSLSELRKAEVQLRAVARQLSRLIEIDERPLTVAREPERRLVGNCRDHSTFAAAILRHHGVPARARCGFGTYFQPNHYEDHWVVDYWRADEGRWATLDAQLDALQRGVLGIAFDTADMPAGAFVSGGAAWRMCRRGEADPDAFGIFQWHGWGFIRGNLLRDFAAQNKLEALPWDFWGLMRSPENPIPAAELALLDRIAELVDGGDAAFAEARALHESDARLRVPDVAAFVAGDPLGA
jgi:hypothetical protein